VGAWPHFRLLQRQLRARAEARRRKAEDEDGDKNKRKKPPPRTAIPLGTLAAIHAQEAQHRASRLHPQHRAAMPALARRYWPTAPAGGPAPTTPTTPASADVIELAAAADMPPCLLVRRLAEHLLRAPKGAVAEALRDASGAAMRRLADRAAAAAPSSSASALALGAAPTTPTTTITTYHALADALLRDAARAALADRCYSPAADAARALAGHEGEAALGAALRRAGVPFWTENDLRARGLFKTPDAWLQAPAAVRVPRGWRRRRSGAKARRRKGGGEGGGGGSSNDNPSEHDDKQQDRDADKQDPSASDSEEDDWRVVHWVDSKACFGDARAHGAALEGQYRQYADRYGPGLVVYWAGHVSGLEGATWPGWRDDLRRDVQELGGEEGEAGAVAGGSGDGGDSGNNKATSPAPPPWLVVVMDRFPRPEDVRLLPRVRNLVGVEEVVAAARDRGNDSDGGG
jgi:hypothetical protein